LSSISSPCKEEIDCWKIADFIGRTKEAIYRADLPAHGYAHVVRVAMRDVTVNRIVECETLPKEANHISVTQDFSDSLRLAIVS